MKPDAVVLLNNAGVLHKGWSEQELKETLAANVEARSASLDAFVCSTLEQGPIGLTNALLPLLQTLKWAHIINVSSGYASDPESCSSSKSELTLGGAPLHTCQKVHTTELRWRSLATDSE